MLRHILNCVEKIVKGFMVVRTSEQKFKGQGGPIAMARGQEKGSTSLLGLKDYV